MYYRIPTRLNENRMTTKGNEMEKISILAKDLKAAALFAAKNDIRYYLNAVQLEVYDSGATKLIATNGHFCGVVSRGKYVARDTVRFVALMPASGIELLLKTKLASFEFEFEADACRCVNAGITFNQVDEKFPDWRRVVCVAAENESVAQFDATYLLAIEKAAKLLGDGDAVISHRGKNAAPFHTAEGVLRGVIMPMRTRDFDFSIFNKW